MRLSERLGCSVGSKRNRFGMITTSARRVAAGGARSDIRFHLDSIHTKILYLIHVAGAGSMRGALFVSIAERVAAIDPSNSESAQAVTALRAELDRALDCGQLSLPEWRELREEASSARARVAPSAASGGRCQICEFVTARDEVKQKLTLHEQRSRARCYQLGAERPQ